MKKLFLTLILLFGSVSILLAQEAPYSVVYGVSEEGQHHFYRATFTESWVVQRLPEQFLFGQFDADFVAPIWSQGKMYVVQPQSPEPENGIAVTLGVYDPQSNRLAPIMDVLDPSRLSYYGIKINTLSPDGRYALVTSTTNYYAPPYIVDLRAGKMLWRPECIASVVAWGTSDVLLFTSVENAVYTSYGGTTTCTPNLTRFNLQTGSVIKVYPIPDSDFVSLGAETQLLVGDVSDDLSDATLTLFNLATGDSELLTYVSGLFPVPFNWDGSHLSIIDEQREETQTTYTLITWQDHKRAEQVLYRGSTPLAASLRPSGDAVALITSEGMLHVYTAAGVTWEHKDVTLPSIDAVDNTWMGDWLVLKDKSVFLLNTVTGDEVHKVPANTQISSVSPDGVWWLLTAYDAANDVSILTAWNINTGEEVVLGKGYLDQGNFHWSPMSYYAWSR